MRLISSLFRFVAMTSHKYSIDESHGLSHSMEVLKNAHDIYNSQIDQNPQLQKQERLIYVSCILHDMCDKKYMNETQGILEIEDFLNNKIPPREIAMTKKIISTMSYSTVKNKGFPNLEEHQLAYHIVREADLLSAYDVDRSIIYNMHKMNENMTESYANMRDLFNNRIFKHFEDGLFITDFSKKRGRELELEAYRKIRSWEEIMKIM